jgi:hypothetical protein
LMLRIKDSRRLPGIFPLPHASSPSRLIIHRRHSFRVARYP